MVPPFSIAAWVVFLVPVLAFGQTEGVAEPGQQGGYFGEKSVSSEVKQPGIAKALSDKAKKLCASCWHHDADKWELRADGVAIQHSTGIDGVRWELRERDTILKIQFANGNWSKDYPFTGTKLIRADGEEFIRGANLTDERLKNLRESLCASYWLLGDDKLSLHADGRLEQMNSDAWQGVFWRLAPDGQSALLDFGEHGRKLYGIKDGRLVRHGMPLGKVPKSE